MPEKIKVEVRWGEYHDHSETTHEFDTPGEAQAFIRGVDMTIGFGGARAYVNRFLAMEELTEIELHQPTA